MEFMVIQISKQINSDFLTAWKRISELDLIIFDEEPHSCLEDTILPKESHSFKTSPRALLELYKPPLLTYYLILGQNRRKLPNISRYQ